jgi:hypothetical protein
MSSSADSCGGVGGAWPAASCVGPSGGETSPGVFMMSVWIVSKQRQSLSETLMCKWGRDGSWWGPASVTGTTDSSQVSISIDRCFNNGDPRRRPGYCCHDMTRRVSPGQVFMFTPGCVRHPASESTSGLSHVVAELHLQVGGTTTSLRASSRSSRAW